jgi:hypothetical protein
MDNVHSDTFAISSDSIRLVFSRTNGTLVGIESATSNWKILDRPELGLSFRLLLPLPGRRNNPVHGERQIPSRIEMDPNGRRILIRWDGVVSEFGGAHDIRLELEVRVEGAEAVFTMSIDNRSDSVIESVHCPYFGDVRRPDGAAWFKTFLYSYATAQEWNLWPKYDNMRGYYGVDRPIQVGSWSASSGSPMSPFFLMRDERQGLYAGVRSNSAELVAWTTELYPGYDESIDAHMPEVDRISGKDVCVRFAAVHMPFLLPGESRTLTPVSVSTFEGGWQKGVDIYTAWRRTWMHPASVPTWAAEPHAWLQLHINSPEDELRMRFTDLVEVGRDCARLGVRAIQLVGWNDGGQDQGNPSHDPDPRLGTFQELKDAIREIQSLGVKVVLFAKFTWADRATEWFRKDLKRLAIKDPYGDYYMHGGYQYQTMTQLLDINTKRLVPMCFLSEDYLKVCETEFRKLVELGADGMLFDECLHHSPALLCFDPSHGHRHGAPVYANDRLLIQRFRSLLPPGREFLMSGEACYDWEMEAYSLSYHRSESRTHIPLSRYMLPAMPFMTAVTGFNDRNMIGQCLMYKYVVSYEPYNFKGRLDDFPLTITYGHRMDALRTELREYLWDGEFRHECGATVETEDGAAAPPYSVFARRGDGRRAVVVCNYDHDKPLRIRATLEDGVRLSKYRFIEDADWTDVSDWICIPPNSAVVVL